MATHLAPPKVNYGNAQPASLLTEPARTRDDGWLALTQTAPWTALHMAPAVAPSVSVRSSPAALVRSSRPSLNSYRAACTRVRMTMPNRPVPSHENHCDIVTARATRRLPLPFHLAASAAACAAASAAALLTPQTSSGALRATRGCHAACASGQAAGRSLWPPARTSCTSHRRATRGRPSVCPSRCSRAAC